MRKRPMRARLAPGDVLLPAPCELVELPDGRLLLRHREGLTVLGGASRREVETLLTAVDGERTATQVVDAVAGKLSTRRASSLLRRLHGEVLRTAEGLGEMLLLGYRLLVLGAGPFAGLLASEVDRGLEVEHREALIPEPLPAADLAVCAPAEASYRELFAAQAALLPARISTLFLTGDPDGFRLGPAAIPGASPCLACAQLAALAPVADLAPAGRIEAAAAFASRLPAAGPVLERLVRGAAAEVRTLLDPGGEPLSATGQLFLPAGARSWRHLPVERHAACPLCAGLKPAAEPPPLASRARRLAAEAWQGETLRAAPAADREPVAAVGILGGGTAGYLAALALRRKVPDLAVTLVESPEVPVIGVGEATTPLMPQFLHADLGLPIGQLFAEVEPTLKLGIRFLWGEAGTGDFPYPFGPLHLLEACTYGGGPAEASLQALLMAADAVPLFQEGEGLPLPRFGTDVAYHLDNRRFAAYLARRAAEAGVERVEATVERVETAKQGGEIGALILGDGRRLAFDLYIDASGFRSLLLEGSLGSPWVSFASSLATDRAVVAAVPHRGPLRPYTTAETMRSGWCWSTPQADADHRGYVFASAFQGDAEAEAEMRRASPGMGEARVLRFRAGRHHDFWKGNAVALGNAYAFVEPLESTALHMLLRQIGLLVRAFPLARGERSLPGLLSRRVAAWWDYLRFFLALHFRFNRRLDSPFWRWSREELELGPQAELLDLYRQRGPLSYDRAARTACDAPDPLWGPAGIDTVLLGQGVLPAHPPRPRLSRAAWAERLSLARAAAGTALPHRKALELLARQPALLSRLEEDFHRAGEAFPAGAP